MRRATGCWRRWPRRLATRLARSRDLLARLEGDRFALLLARIQLPTLFTIADAFRNVLSEVQAERFGVQPAR